MPELGNAWHIADHAEPPGQANMRSPIEECTSNSAIAIFSGNQYRGGGGGAANQHQMGSRLVFRKSTSPVWSESDLKFHSRRGNNEYYSATIKANTFQVGDSVQYYLRIAYDPNVRQITFLHGSDGRSQKAGDEVVAQAQPFSFVVRQPPRASGDFLQFEAGTLRARIYRATGIVQLAGPDFARTPQAVALTFAVGARIAGQAVAIGRVISSTTLANGLELVQELALESGPTTIAARLTFAHEGVMRYEISDWRGLVAEKTSISGDSPVEEHFYGFGEKFNAFDQSGKAIRTVTLDQPGDKGDHSYKPAPWFVSTRGYGFHLDSTAESTFDMRASDTGRYAVTNYLPKLAFNIVYGPNLKDVLSRHTAYVGRSPLPPPFAFGPWLSSDIWRNGAGVRYVVEKFRRLKIPTSVLVFDSPWETAYNDFKFNVQQFVTALPEHDRTYEGQVHGQFDSLADMMHFFQQNGLKIICWLTPFINEASQQNEGIGDLKVPGQLAKSPNFDEAKQKSLFVRRAGGDLSVGWWKGRGSPVDFTNPSARDWLTNQLRALVSGSEVTTAAGTREPVIGGFKPDDGEALTNLDSTDTPGGEYIPRSAVYHDGRTGWDMRNGYCIEYHKAIYGVLGSSGIIFARSGFTGTQAFPGCWAGDNKQDFSPENGLPSVIVAAQSAAMSGFSIWSHDIGGYQNRSDLSAAEKADVFIRWTQFGCFTPIMQLHRQPVAGEQRQYPWGYPVGTTENFERSVALDNYRYFARLHTRLFPYIYTYAKQSQELGLPIIRPLVLMHQDDANTFAIEHTYYFGSEFLVAPVIVPKATKRNVYLPPGNWYEFWTNSRIGGGQVVKWQVSEGSKIPRAFQFPLYIRAGAIIPLLLTVPESLCDENYVNAVGTLSLQKDPGLLFLFYPHQKSSFTLYDGSEVSCQVDGSTTKLNLTSVAREVGMNVFSTNQPGSIQLDAVNLSGPLITDQFEAAKAGWRFDSECRFVRIKFAHLGGAAEVVIA